MPVRMNSGDELRGRKQDGFKEEFMKINARNSSLLQRASIFVAILVSIASFQNCSKQTAFDSSSLGILGASQTGGLPSSTESSGGAGVDGMRYLSYAACANGTVGVKTEIDVSSDYSTANLVTQNCTQLATPILVTSEVQYSSSKAVLIWNGNQILDQQNQTDAQVVTSDYCTGVTTSGIDVVAEIWAPMSSSSVLFGSVSQNGTSFGSLQITTSVGNSVFIGSGGGNNMNLTLLSGSGTLSYSINGVSSQSLNLTCITQSVPNSGTVNWLDADDDLLGTSGHHSGLCTSVTTH
jgi:hypothetical protein